HADRVGVAVDGDDDQRVGVEVRIVRDQRAIVPDQHHVKQFVRRAIRVECAQARHRGRDRGRGFLADGHIRRVIERRRRQEGRLSRGGQRRVGRDRRLARRDLRWLDRARRVGGQRRGTGRIGREGGGLLDCQRATVHQDQAAERQRTRQRREDGDRNEAKTSV